MPHYQHTQEEMHQFLKTCPVGSFATVNADGTPYVVPLNYVHLDDAIYMHAALKGQKLTNIENRPQVAMTFYHMEGVLKNPEGNPCRTNTLFSSVVITGKAVIIDDITEKESALREFLVKYTPEYKEKPMSEQMISRCAVIKITIETMTGRYRER